MTPGELRRLYFIIHTFLSYGLDELIPKMRITLPLRIWRRMLFWMPNRHQDQPLGARLRLALQELGPVWIKFGQMLSTRRDLFPPHIADQLALLQDRVAPFEGKLAQQQIEKAMGGLPVETWFDDFSVEPLASASIAQVHTARLKENGKEVVIKVIRPDILPIIKADMKLIYRLARWVPRLLPDGRRLRPQEVVREYEKTLLDELNLLRESANAIQLRRNFEDSPMLYVPEVYPDYCSESMMVMERITVSRCPMWRRWRPRAPICSCWRSGACRSSSPRCSATASSMPICILATYSSATSIRKIRSISASTAVLSAH